MSYGEIKMRVVGKEFPVYVYVFLFFLSFIFLKELQPQQTTTVN